jgi:integrase/recombinase XerD
MSCRGEFSSWLAPYFARFVAMKRACGAQYEEGALLLAAFDRHVCDQAPSPPLGREVLLTYLDARGHLCDRSRDNVVTVVWQAVEFAARHGARVGPLPPRPLRPRSSLRLRQPRVLSVQEAGAVLRAARELPPAGSLRSATCATLFGLLLATGIRIGEALALCVEDLDLVQGVLTVRRGKFGKSRILPLRESTVAALQRCLHHPKRRVGRAKSDPIFVSELQRRLSHPAAAELFARACSNAGIAGRVRLHDLRHTFAVQRVATWYSTGQDLHTLLPALSTYLGHVSLENTRTYLRANGLLLESACRLFETATVGLDEVLS